MKSYIRKIATSPLGVKLRNLTGWRSVPISFCTSAERMPRFQTALYGV